MTTETIVLKFPTEGGLTKLSMRRPKVRDMLVSDKAKGSDADKEVALFANLCEISPEEFEGLDVSDYKAVQEVYKGFLS